MNRTRSRSFTLFDALVLFAATAASFAWSRDVVAARAINSFDAWTLSNRPEGRGRAVNLVYYRTEHAVPPIAGRWCRFAAYLTQRLALCPCPTLAAWTLAIFVLTLLDWGDWWIAMCFALPRVAALAVAISWITLAQSGRCRRDGGWLDRLGTLLGACWIALGVIRIVSSGLEAFLI